MTSTLFISDLHLSAERPEIIATFRAFLETQAARAQTLYILGDLFEYWIGDDAAGLPEYAGITDALAGLTARGVPVWFMAGNRDFLVGADYALHTGMRLLPDPTVIDLYGERVLLMHGDTLCTDDVDYQRFRTMVRDPGWIAGVLAKPIPERLALVRDLRKTSRSAMAGKRPEIMDVNPDAVTASMRQHHVRHLIHGHTHRPAQHVFSLDGAEARRTVLGDWYEQGSALVCDEQGCRKLSL